MSIRIVNLVEVDAEHDGGVTRSPLDLLDPSELAIHAVDFLVDLHMHPGALRGRRS